MSVSPVLAATAVIAPRNVPNPLVLHLSGASGASESEYEPAAKPSASRRPVIVNGKFLLSSKRIYKCTFESCEKSYTKPSRLEEHERSHTGDVSSPHIYSHS
jgi:general transcription factor IIIA